MIQVRSVGSFELSMARYRDRIVNSSTGPAESRAAEPKEEMQRLMSTIEKKNVFMIMAVKF